MRSSASPLSLLSILGGSATLGDEERAMPLIETEEAARRLARAIASDLSLYNEDKIISGITNDNLFDTLAEEIEEGRALYKRRVSPELYPKNYYDRALVDILIKAKGHIKSKIW
jgi:predicted transcriptional regulator